MLNGNIIRALALHSSYQSRISGQLRRLGGSYDWNRVAFTMDEVCVHVLFAMHLLVNRAFRYLEPVKGCGRDILPPS